MDYPLYEFGGSGSVMTLMVANGFPPQTYLPLMRGFKDRYRVVCPLPRALWPNEQPADNAGNWRQLLARDYLDVLRQHDMTDVIAVGHSFGGIASMLAMIEEPARFKALILLDPTILTPDLLAGMEIMQQNGTIDQMPLAARAIKRQRDFESVKAASEYFQSKRLFANWDAEALHLYAEHGTKPTKSGVTLAWSPEWEAHYFMTGYTRMWDDIPKAAGLAPTLILRGSNSDTFIAESAVTVRELLPAVDYQEIEGGHLFPHESPLKTYTLMDKFVRELGD